MNQYLYSYVRPRLIKMVFIFKIALSTVELTNNSSLQVKKKNQMEPRIQTTRIT